MIFTNASAPENDVFLVHQGMITFTSDAPMETIKGYSKKIMGVINTSKRTFAFSVNNRTIEGFNNSLQKEHFYENYIEADKYPVSTFEGKIIEQVDFSKDGEYTVRAKGILNIHGVKRERIIKCTLRVKGGALFIKSRFTILLAEHNITIPRIVFQKIANEISIDMNAEFSSTDPGAR